MPESTSRRLLRYAIVAAIVLVIGGLFVQRELLGDEEGADGASEAASLGPLDERPLEVGEPAPDFRLETLSHGTISLADFRGQTIVLNFWATWCPPCREEMPEFEALYNERLPEENLTVIAVDFTPEDTREAAQNFVADRLLSFPIALDTASGEVADRYGVHGLPATFFIDAEGILRARVYGPVFGDLLPENVAKADAGASSG